MPIAAANRDSAPMTQNSVPNHGATAAFSSVPSTFRKPMPLASPERPNTVEYASIDMNRMVMNEIAANVTACSMLATFHQRRQRAMLPSSGSKMNPDEVGA